MQQILDILFCRPVYPLFTKLGFIPWKLTAPQGRALLENVAVAGPFSRFRF
jgi:hypothetical protein